jgi:hypothetical protein
MRVAPRVDLTDAMYAELENLAAIDVLEGTVIAQFIPRNCHQE